MPDERKEEEVERKGKQQAVADEAATGCGRAQAKGLTAKQKERVRRRLELLYSEGDREQCLTAIDALVEKYNVAEGAGAALKGAVTQGVSERDIALITYGDLIEAPGRHSLRTLGDFTKVFFEGLVTILHVLPFFPYSSDRGFAVIDYFEVDERLGTCTKQHPVFQVGAPILR